MQAVPSFIAQARRQRVAEAAQRVDTAAHREPPHAPANPFVRAADDLAAEWDVMVARVERAEADARSFSEENVHLRESVRSLTLELERTRTQLSLDVEHQTRRADDAVKELADTRSRFAIIAQALQMVLDQERENLGAPKRQASGGAKGPQGGAMSGGTGRIVIEEAADADGEGTTEIRSIINRLPTVSYR